MVRLFLRNDGSSLRPSGKVGRSLLRSFVNRSISKQKVSFADHHVSYEDSMDPSKEEDQPLLVAARQAPWTEFDDFPHLSSLQVTHFQMLSEVKQPSRLQTDEEAAHTRPLPPPSFTKLKARPPTIVACESTSTESSPAASLASTSTCAVASEYHQQQEANLMRELFHDLTCRCFTITDPRG